MFKCRRLLSARVTVPYTVIFISHFNVSSHFPFHTTPSYPDTLHDSYMHFTSTRSEAVQTAEASNPLFSLVIAPPPHKTVTEVREPYDTVAFEQAAYSGKGSKKIDEWNELSED